jgi:translation elongation factor EF-Ts
MFFEQKVLLEQPFAKDSSKSVAEYLRENGGDDATVIQFVRFKLGEVASQ